MQPDVRQEPTQHLQHAQQRGPQVLETAAATSTCSSDKDRYPPEATHAEPGRPSDASELELGEPASTRQQGLEELEVLVRATEPEPLVLPWPEHSLTCPVQEDPGGRPETPKDSGEEAAIWETFLSTLDSVGVTSANWQV